jgi:hypothetical protein
MKINFVAGPQPEAEEERTIELRLEYHRDFGVGVRMYEHGRTVADGWVVTFGQDAEGKLTLRPTRWVNTGLVAIDDGGSIVITERI